MSDVLFQLTPCARLRSFFEIAKYSKHKKNDLKKDLDGDFGDQLSAANLYFLMQRRQVDVIPDSLSYTDKDISFILSNGDETMALRFTPYLNHNEKLTDVYYRPLGSDMKSAVGIEWETSDNNANCITVYSITSDIANTVPQSGNVYGRFKILKGKPDWLLDFLIRGCGRFLGDGLGH